MATLRLYLDTRSTRPNGTHPIRLAVNHHGGTAFISLSQYVRKEEWDKRLCKVRKRPDRDVLNDFLLNRMSFYNRMMMQAQCRETYRGDITAKQLKDLILQEAEPQREKAVLLHDVYERYLSRDMRPSTRNNYECTWRAVERFDQNAASLTLEQVTRDWVERFNLFLIKEGKIQNTRTIRLRHVAAVFNYAIDMELTNNYPFRRFNLSLCETAYRDLSIDELRAVLNAEVQEKHRPLLDCFMLMFLLIGINTHDLYNLTPDCIVNGRLEYRRLKTGKIYSIKLLPEAVSIIEQYKGTKKLLSFCERYRNSGSFSIAINNVLHSVRKGLTTYYARHTWATLAFKLGISKDTISLALGHSFGVRVTSTYINADLSRVDEANRKVVDWVLYDRK